MSGHRRHLVSPRATKTGSDNGETCERDVVWRRPATGQIVITEADHATAETFQAFLDALRAAFPDKTIHLVLDNAKIHHAKALQPYLTDHPELDLRFLPPYSPNLNNTERLWKWLREKVILNTCFIRQAIARFLSYLATVPDEIQSRLGRLPA